MVTSLSRKSCVLYFMSNQSAALGNKYLLNAQQQALNLGVPLAVIYCMANQVQSKKESLISIEKELQEFNIPLMILLGDEQKTKNAIIHHTKPAVVINDKDETDQDLDNELVAHPYPWPGIVLGVDQIYQLQDFC